MRCVGADNPPCVRCVKVGRTCHIPHAQETTQVAGSHQPSPLSQIHASSGLQHADMDTVNCMPSLATEDSTASRAAGRAGNRSNSSTQQSSHAKIINLPSVYMNSPLVTIDAQLKARSTAGYGLQSEILRQSSKHEPSPSLSPVEISHDSLVRLLQL